MSTRVSELIPLQVVAGVEPVTEKTSFQTKHFTFSDKIRFVNGVPEKIGGWYSVSFEYSDAISGYARSMYSLQLGEKTRTVIGTHKNLYSLSGQRLTNVTPLQTTSTAAANSLATDYRTLASNPLTTVSGSVTIAVSDTSAATYYKAGDRVTLFGLTTTGGVGTGLLNAEHIVRSVNASGFTIKVSSPASSDSTGGGSIGIIKSGLITLTKTSHGVETGQRVKISGATDSGGVLAASINKEFIARGATSNTFAFMTDGIATSSVTGSGGASTVFYKQLTDGNQDENVGRGYGVGRYGTGLYGTARESTQGRRYPRIWSFDTYGTSIIATAGNQTGIYSWDGNTATAPILLANAPTEVNYVFVSNSIVVTFGEGGVVNRIKTSDQSDPTEWTSSSVNQVFVDDIEGAGRFISHVSVLGDNLLFTERQTYRFTYIGQPFIWRIEKLDDSVGIISQNARCVANGTAYWMGQKNFYRWRGGLVEIVPSNSQMQTTLLHYIFDNLTASQKSKIFAWYHPQFDEIWWHYPSVGSIECDRVARFCVRDQTWTPDTMERTCAEYPHHMTGYPRLCKNDTLYVHEYGTDADGAAMTFELETSLQTLGKKVSLLSGFTPDDVSNQNISLRIEGFQHPQSSSKTYDETYTVSPDTEYVPIQISARNWKFTFSGGVIGQSWRLGQWQYNVQLSGDK